MPYGIPPAIHGIPGMLTDAKLRAIRPDTKPYRVADSRQFYLLVTPAGGRLWRMNYSSGHNAAGKLMQKTLSFGAYPTVSLAATRARRDEAKRLLVQNLDPAVVWREGDERQGCCGRPDVQGHGRGLVRVEQRLVAGQNAAVGGKP